MRKPFLLLFLAVPVAALCSFAAAPQAPSEEGSAVRDRIVQRLDPKGRLYGYSVFPGDLSRTLDELTKKMEAGPHDEPSDALFKQDYSALASELGLTQVSGFGYSSTARPGGYENRAFLSFSGERKGLWALMGGPAHPFETLRFAPKDTDLFIEVDLDLPAALRSVTAVLKRFAPEKAAEFDLDAPAAGEAKPWQALSGLRGRTTLVVRTHAGKEGEPALDLLKLALSATPADVLLRIEGLGTKVLPLLDTSKLTKKKGKKRLLYAGGEKATDGAPAWARNVVLAVDGTTLLAASSEAFLEESLARTDHLGQLPVLQTALSALGKEGNSLTYASPALFKLIHLGLQLSPTLLPLGQGASPFLQRLAENFPQPAEPVVSVSANLPDGIYSRSWTPQSLQTAAVIMNLLSPEIAGQIIAEAVIAAQRSQLKERELARATSKIQQNLGVVDAAARHYFSEHEDAKEVNWEQLLEAAPTLKELTAYAGEDYTTLVVKRASDKLNVTTSDYNDIAYVRPLTDAEKAEILRRLEVIDRTVAVYLANNPESSTCSFMDAVELEPTLKDFASLAGEDYNPVAVGRTDPTIRVQTEGGQEVALTRDSRLPIKLLKDRLRTEADLTQKLQPLFVVAQAYLAKEQTEAVSFSTLLESNAATKPEGFTDEELADLTFSRNNYHVSLKHGPRTLVLSFPLDAKMETQLKANAQQIAAAAEGYFQKFPDEPFVVVAELVGPGQALATLPASIAGEDYSLMVVRRADSAVSLTIPNGPAISAPLHPAKK